MANHPALTLPKISVGSDRVDCLVAKIGFGIELGRLESSTKQDEFGGSGCSAVASVLRSGRRGRWFEPTHPVQLVTQCVGAVHSYIIVADYTVPFTRGSASLLYQRL